MCFVKDSTQFYTPSPASVLLGVNTLLDLYVFIWWLYRRSRRSRKSPSDGASSTITPEVAEMTIIQEERELQASPVLPPASTTRPAPPGEQPTLHLEDDLENGQIRNKLEQWARNFSRSWLKIFGALHVVAIFSLLLEIYLKSLLQFFLENVSCEWGAHQKHNFPSMSWFKSQTSEFLSLTTFPSLSYIQSLNFFQLIFRIIRTNTEYEDVTTFKDVCPTSNNKKAAALMFNALLGGWRLLYQNMSTQNLFVASSLSHFTLKSMESICHGQKREFPNWTGTFA